MRLLFIGTTAELRGTETHLITLARSVASLGHEVEAVTRPGSFVEAALARSGLRTWPATFRNVLDPKGWWGVHRAAAALRPQWLVSGFAHEYWATVGVAAFHGARAALFRHMAMRLSFLPRLLLPRWAGRFIAVSDYLRELLAGQGVPRERLAVLRNPIDVERFVPGGDGRAQARAKLGVPDEAVLVGFVGAAVRDKGADFLRETLSPVMERDGRVHALWVTSRPPRADFFSTVSTSLRPRHHVVGPVEELAPWYQAMDVAAVPSLWPEAFGRVAAEAQAVGVPVLASRCGGLGEALGPGAGELLPPGDARAWTEALTSLARASRERRCAMGEAGRAFVQTHLAAPTIARAFVELLEHPTRWATRRA